MSVKRDSALPIRTVDSALDVGMRLKTSILAGFQLAAMPLYLIRSGRNHPTREMKLLECLSSLLQGIQIAERIITCMQTTGQLSARHDQWCARGATNEYFWVSRKYAFVI
jgi:hypothetical protein